MADVNASDMFFCTGIPPHLKIEGEISKMGHQAFKAGEVQELAYSIITEKQKEEFEKTMELNCTVSIDDVGRYRVNMFRQRGEVSLVIRYTQPKVPQIADIDLPEILKNIIMEKEGLVLIVGAAGSGKSTTLAAMIDHRNRNCISHVLMIEDHIEYVHQHNKSIVQQREIGEDTISYENALKNVLREAPDVIAIGDIRDRTTMQHAIDYGKTGQLCVATLTARNASQALDRILGFFPDAIHSHVLSDLSFNLRAIISQRLIPGIDGKRIVAVEVMFNTTTIAELIKRRDVSGIKRAMKNSQSAGCVTFDQALLKLYQEGKISLEETINNADSKNDISLAIRMSEDSEQDDFKIT
jgi:twitching motility protein PilU